MAKQEHIEIVKQGRDAIERWRLINSADALDLEGAELPTTNLSTVNLGAFPIRQDLGSKGHVLHCRRPAILRNAILHGADLSSSNFAMVDFTGADLSDARISNSQFARANLSKCKCDRADLSNSDFVETTLVGTSLRQCNLVNTSFANLVTREVGVEGCAVKRTLFSNCDMREFIGLEKVNHYGPSSIGIDTLLRSEGDIPHVFLRGCGLPDHIIDFVDSIAKKPIQFYSCFLSHSTKDKAFAKHLFNKLQGAGVRCWYFPESARTGEPLREEISRAIRFHDKLVIICTRNSLNSQPVIDEIEEGLQREQEEKIRRHNDEEKVVKGEWTQDEFGRQRYHTKVLFPIALDDYIFSDWKHPLGYELHKTRVVGDFRGWEGDFATFDKAFQKLLNDLNSTD